MLYHNNHCKDDEDTACYSGTTYIPGKTPEAGGTCKTQPTKCADTAFKPKLSELIITPEKGQRQFNLRWKDECTAASYDIFRCKGKDCTNFEKIAASSSSKTKSFLRALAKGATFFLEIGFLTPSF